MSGQQVPAKRSSSGSDSNSSHPDELQMKRKSKKSKNTTKNKNATDSKSNPELHFDATGFQYGKVVTIFNVRDLILHILGDGGKQQWMYVSNKEKIERAVMLFIPGLEPQSLGLSQDSLSQNMPCSLIPKPKTSLDNQDTDTTETPENLLPVFKTLFSHFCPTRAPGDQFRLFSCFHHLTTCPPSQAKLQQKKNQKSTVVETDPLSYILTMDLMDEQEYPIPSYATPDHFVERTSIIHFQHYDSNIEQIDTIEWSEWKKSDGWIETPVNARTTFENGQEQKPKIIGIDCEMVTTSIGSEITRVTMVDESKNVIYDSLIKPSREIVDYRTQWSGMTEERLKNVTTTLEDVQQDIIKFIDYDTILVGHSLECDLKALQLIHPWVVDTALCFEHPRGAPFKPSLKWLAQKWLKKEIQVESKTGDNVIGHDSEEDAKTALELFQLKIEKGRRFGQFGNDHQSVFERLSESPRGQIKGAIVDHGKPGAWAGLKAATNIGCQSDIEVFENVKQIAGEHEFVFARCMDLSKAKGWDNRQYNNNKNNNSAQAENNDGSDKNESPLSVAQAHELINKQIDELHQSLPPNSLLVIVSGHSDPREMSKLNARKQRFDRVRRNASPNSLTSLVQKIEHPDGTSEDATWLSQDDRQLQEEVAKAKMGMAFFKVRH